MKRVTASSIFWTGLLPLFLLSGCELPQWISPSSKAGKGTAKSEDRKSGSIGVVSNEPFPPPGTKTLPGLLEARVYRPRLALHDEKPTDDPATDMDMDAGLANLHFKTGRQRTEIAGVTFNGDAFIFQRAHLAVTYQNLDGTGPMVPDVDLGRGSISTKNTEIHGNNVRISVTNQSPVIIPFNALDRLIVDLYSRPEAFRVDLHNRSDLKAWLVKQVPNVITLNFLDTYFGDPSFENFPQVAGLPLFEKLGAQAVKWQKEKLLEQAQAAFARELTRDEVLDQYLAQLNSHFSPIPLYRESAVPALVQKGTLPAPVNESFWSLKLATWPSPLPTALESEVLPKVWSNVDNVATVIADEKALSGLLEWYLLGIEQGTTPLPDGSFRLNSEKKLMTYAPSNFWDGNSLINFLADFNTSIVRTGRYEVSLPTSAATGRVMPQIRPWFIKKGDQKLLRIDIAVVFLCISVDDRTKEISVPVTFTFAVNPANNRLELESATPGFTREEIADTSLVVSAPRVPQAGKLLRFLFVRSLVNSRVLGNITAASYAALGEGVERKAGTPGSYAEAAAVYMKLK